MGDLRRQAGFWASLGRMRFSSVLTPEIGGGLLLGVTGSVLMIKKAELPARVDMVGGYLVLSASLIGIVFAALALVVALFSDDYLRYLEGSEGPGVIAFLSPFMFAIGCQVGVLLGSVIYKAGAAMFPSGLETWFFGAISTLFTIAVLDVVALARSVMMHGIGRARVQKVTDFAKSRDRKRAADS